MYEVVQGDSFALLKTLPEVDVIITDPPYDAHCQANQMSGTTLAKVDLPFEPLASTAFARDLVRVAKRWAIAFCTVEDLGLYQQSVGGRRTPKGSGAYVRGGIWYKPNSMGQLTGDRPAASYEGLAIMHRPGGKMHWNGRGSFAFWCCSGTRGEPDRHPNQKPLALCLELVNKFTDPGETVFDPFAGSGRIGEACMLLGRHYIGVEKDAEWCAKARARLASAAERWGSMSDKLELNALRMSAEAHEYLEKVI